jgi:hypothetical protein
LDLTMGGASVDILSAPYTKRRTLYGFIERQNLPSLFRTFDFATPDISTLQRFHTTIPQQALYMMNSPFVMEAVKGAATRPEIATLSPNAKVNQLYRLLFQRQPAPDELQLGLQFLQRSTSALTPPVWQYGYGGIDAAGQKVTQFTALPHWSGSAWQGGKQMPDPKLSYLFLSAEGGHPGTASDQMVIRRWVSPINGTVKITGMLRHLEKRGDGVRLRVISSRTGRIGLWTAYNSTADTGVEDIEVRKGDMLDFVVDNNGTLDFDSFTYAPTITAQTEAGTKTIAQRAAKSWSAKQDFGGPETQQQQGLSAWERYVQALLMTNEFCFVE